MSPWLKKQIKLAKERLKNINPERLKIIRGKYEKKQMSEDITLKELMEDLSLQTELGHDKTKLDMRRKQKKREKEHDNEVKLKRKRARRIPETEEQRRLRKYKSVELD